MQERLRKGCNRHSLMPDRRIFSRKHDRWINKRRVMDLDEGRGGMIWYPAAAHSGGPADDSRMIDGGSDAVTARIPIMQQVSPYPLSSSLT